MEVSIEPGNPTLENYDPEKLKFDYNAYFIDSRTMAIDIIFTSPVYISGSQPEDVLVITFQGPIYDKQDGLPLPDTSKTIRQAIPP